MSTINATGLGPAGGTSTQTPGFTGGFTGLVDPLTQGAFAAFQQPFPGSTAGDVVAPFNPSQLGAFGTVSNIANNPAYATAIGAAGTGTVGSTLPPDYFTHSVNGLTRPVGYQSIRAPTFGSAEASAYESPYTQNLVTQALADFDQNAARETAQNRAHLAGEGAFGAGGSESEALLTGQHERGRAALDASLRNAAFTNAQQQFNADTNRGLTAATSNQNAGLAASGLTGTNLARAAALGPVEQQTQLAGNKQYADLAMLLHNLGLTDANALLNVGNQQQQQDQAGRTFTYQQKLAANKYPWDQTNSLAGILYGSPKSTTTVANPGTSAAQGIGLGIAGIGAIPGAIKGASSLADLLGLGGGGSSGGGGLGPGGASIVPDLSVLPDMSPVSDFLPPLASGGRVRGAFERSAPGRGAFADGGDVAPDAGADAPAMDISGMIGSARMSDPVGGKGLSGWAADMLDNPLVALGASIAATPGRNLGLALGQGIEGGVKLAPELRQLAAKTRLLEAQGSVAQFGVQQQRNIMDAAQGIFSTGADPDGKPVRLVNIPQLTKLGIAMTTMDGRKGNAILGFVNSMKGTQFDSNGNIAVTTGSPEATAIDKLAKDGALPGGASMPAVTPVAGAPAALATFAGSKAGAEADAALPAKLTTIGAEGAQARDTQAAGNKVVPPNSTVIPGGTGAAPIVGKGSAFAPQPAPPRPVIGQGSAFSPTSPTQAAPQVRLTTPPVTYTEDDQKALAKEMATTQEAAINAPAAIKQIQDIGREAVNSGPGTLTMSDIATTFNRFGVDINKILPEGWQNDPNKVGIVETNLQELAMSLAKASQSGARFTNADLLAAMQSKPNLMLSPGARSAILDNLEQRERFSLDKAQLYRDYAKQNGQLNWGVVDAWRDKVMKNENYPEDLRRTHMGLNEATAAKTAPASAVPKGAVTVLQDPKTKQVLGYKLSDGTRVKADGSPF